MELPDKIAGFAETYEMLPAGTLILAAVSGGADSMCLLAALGELSEKNGFALAAAHFNHRLRGSDADGDEAFVRRFCEDRGFQLTVGAGDVREYARGYAIGIEAAARVLRYRFFQETAEKIGAGRIATAHTADDNAETVLLNLTRGAGLKGMCGIPPRRGMIVRPMLTVTRREVLEFLSSRSLHFVEDATNHLDIYNRNVIRHRVVPVLSAINPRFADNVASASALIREDEAYLSSLAQAFLDGQNVTDGQSGPVMDARALLALPLPVARRAVRLAAGVTLTSGHVAEILALCSLESPSASLSLPGVAVRREYGRIVFAGTDEPAAFTSIVLTPGGHASIPELGLDVMCRLSPVYENDEKINKSFNTFLFNYDNVCGNIVIRSRETGDKLAISGGNGTKTLKKLFIEKRIPAHRRALVPVIADDAGVLAVLGPEFGPGKAIDKRACRRPGDNTLEIEFKETSHEA